MRMPSGGRSWKVVESPDYHIHTGFRLRHEIEAEWAIVAYSFSLRRADSYFKSAVRCAADDGSRHALCWTSPGDRRVRDKHHQQAQKTADPFHRFSCRYFHSHSSHLAGHRGAWDVPIQECDTSILP